MTQTEIVAIPGQPQIVVTRDFRAPRDLLFRAHTDPELLVQWLGPRTVRMTVDRLETRDGGLWRPGPGEQRAPRDPAPPPDPPAP